MIKYIIFDLSEVIISGYYGCETKIADLLNLDSNEVDRHLMSDIFIELMRGNLTEDEYINKILNQTGWEISLDEFKEIIRKNHNQEVKGTVDILKDLKKKKQYKLILLSDHVKEWIDDILERNKDLEIFEYKYFSYELKAIKSDRVPFIKIIEDMKANSNEILFIDDLKSNIEIAESLGINGIVFKDASSLKNELININVL